MSVGHHQHHSAAPGLNSQALDRLLANDAVREGLYHYRPINREYQIPYVGGYSKDGDTIYVDSHLPERVTLELDGRERDIDPVQFLRMHEALEKTLIDVLGYSYEQAHQAATGYERRGVLQHLGPGWWTPYQMMWRPFIHTDEHEALKRVPASLDMTPYVSPPADARLIERMQAAQGAARRYSKSEANYSDTGTKAEHCSICEHYERPRACSLVRGVILPGGWCKYWEACDDDE